MRRMIQRMPKVAAASNADSSDRRVDPGIINQRKIDHEGVVAYAKSGRVVSTPANRD